MARLSAPEDYLRHVVNRLAAIGSSPLGFRVTGTPEDRAACEPDVQRYCKAEIPDQLRVLGCLQDNRKRISRPCQGVLARYGQ